MTKLAAFSYIKHLKETYCTRFQKNSFRRWSRNRVNKVYGIM